MPKDRIVANVRASPDREPKDGRDLEFSGRIHPVLRESSRNVIRPFEEIAELPVVAETPASWLFLTLSKRLEFTFQPISQSFDSEPIADAFPDESPDR
jgi:hypothetical protein